MKKKLLLLFILFIFSYGCKNKIDEIKDKKGEEPKKEKIINVKAREAEKKSVRPYIKTIGSLFAFDEVTVSSEIDGILKTVKVDDGSVVEKGMLLAQINDSDYKLMVQQAEAVLKQAKANFQNASIDYKRKESLSKNDLLTKQQFDDVLTKLSLAESDVDKAKVAIELAKDKLLKTSINSPISGVIKEKKISAGNYVRGATPIFTIIQINPLKLDFNVAEKDIGKVKLNQEISFTVDSFPCKKFSGNINIIYPNVEEATRTLKVEAKVPNNDGVLKPGLFANVTLYTGESKDTIVTPTISVLYDGSITKIFTVENNIAQEKEVIIGNNYGDLLEILKGIKEKDLVVIAGQQNLAGGVKVNVNR